MSAVTARYEFTAPQFERDWFTPGEELYFCSLSEGVLRTQFGMFRGMLRNFEEAHRLNTTNRKRVLNLRRNAGFASLW